MGKPLKYLIIATELRKAIEQGDYEPDTLLPTEKDLMEKYRVSCTTIRKAMKHLSEEQYVEIRQGMGARVLERSRIKNCNRITTISESLKRCGYEVSNQKNYIDLVDGDDKVRHYLTQENSKKLVRIQTVQEVSGKPVCWITNYIPCELVPGIEEDMDRIQFLYQYLEEKYHIFFTDTVDIACAENADLVDASMLEVPVGTALMHMQRVCYQKSRPVCYEESKVVGSKYKIQIYGHGRDY